MSRKNLPGAEHATPSLSPPFDGNLRTGLALLSQAFVYVDEAEVDVWDFALNVDKLYEAGLTISDLRWLVIKGFAEHGDETSNYGDPHRSFRRSKGFNFAKESCLILTEEGAALADKIMGEFGASQPSTLFIDAASLSRRESLAPDPPAAGKTNGQKPSVKPTWNSQRRELSLADTIVKRFRVPARNQQTILCAFEEENWPDHIDDPLPNSDGVDPRARLHDAIFRLNNHHETANLLRFHGNGTANGVIWEQL